MQFTDTATLGEMRRTNDGYLLADVRTARTGIQEYTGAEMGKPDQKIVRVLRPVDEVFKKDSLATYGSKPVTDDHPLEGVSAQNWKELAVGMVGGEVARDGEFVRIPLMITDMATIDKVEAGKRELSAGYTCDIDWTEGTFTDGTKYDAIQRNIRINHVAIVTRGRAGVHCRIGDDNQWGLRPNHKPKTDRKTAVDELTTRTVMCDGFSVITTDQGAQALEKYLKDNERLTADIAGLQVDHAEKIAAKDKELGEKDAEIAALKTDSITSDKLDGLVSERAGLVSKASQLVDGFKADKLSNEDIRRQVVQKLCGDTAVADKSDDYVTARFDAEASRLKTDAFSQKMSNGLPPQGQQMSDDNKAYDEMIEREQNAWNSAYKPEGK